MAVWDSLSRLWDSYHWSWSHLAVGLLTFAVSFVVTTGAVIWVLIRLPPTYLRAAADRTPRPPRHPLLAVAVWVGKNLVGAVVVLVGFIMALPGVPGPGLVTMALGIVLLEFPGKKQLEQRFVRHPRVLDAINRIRRRFNRQPLEV